METFITVLHVVVALTLILLVLVQDSKGGSLGGAFGGGGGGSNSILGATGAATLASKLTRVAAFVFALTCIALTIHSARGKKSVVDLAPAPAATAAIPTAADGQKPADPVADTDANAGAPAASPAPTASPK